MSISAPIHSYAFAVTTRSRGPECISGSGWHAERSVRTYYRTHHEARMAALKLGVSADDDVERVPVIRTAEFADKWCEVVLASDEDLTSKYHHRGVHVSNRWQNLIRELPMDSVTRVFRTVDRTAHSEVREYHLTDPVAAESGGNDGNTTARAKAKAEAEALWVFRCHRIILPATLGWPFSYE